ncbi:MAG: RNA 3'-terminal phosphate cyclase [Candidatus Kariarchaeaceae archaeon]|jgi:RNA 3'-phosphate cyclase
MNFDIELDGSIGGGSVLRVAVPLALGLNKSIKITNIRNNRKKPGLRTQHLLGLQALAEITDGKLIGGQVGSMEIGFYPNSDGEKKNHIQLNIPTAASISLIIQALCNYSIISKQDIQFDFFGGGTHTNWSPNFDFLEYVSNPVLNQFNMSINLTLSRRGFYPKGDAQGSVSITNTGDPRTVELKSSEVKDVTVTLFASSKLKKAKVLERQFETFSMLFQEKYAHPLHSDLTYGETSSTGTSATVIINYELMIPKGITQLGERGISSEEIGHKLFKDFEKNISQQSVLDEYMADQIVLPLAMSKLGSWVSIPGVTDHVKTNIQLVNSILGKTIELEYDEETIRLIRI